MYECLGRQCTSKRLWHILDTDPQFHILVLFSSSLLICLLCFRYFFSHAGLKFWYRKFISLILDNFSLCFPEEGLPYTEYPVWCHLFYTEISSTSGIYFRECYEARRIAVFLKGLQWWHSIFFPSDLKYYLYCIFSCHRCWAALDFSSVLLVNLYISLTIKNFYNSIFTSFIVLQCSYNCFLNHLNFYYFYWRSCWNCIDLINWFGLKY